MSADRLSKLLTVRLRPSEKADVFRAAATKDQTVSEFSRSVLLPVVEQRLRAAEQGGESEDQ